MVLNPVRRVQVAIAAVLTLAVQACATLAPSSMSFNPAAATGLAIVASAPVEGLQTLVFRKVDLGSNTFLKDTVTVSSGGIGNPNRIADAASAGAALAAQEFAPGDYALVELTQPGSVGYATTMSTLCLGAPIVSPVFRIEAGRISIVRVDVFSAALTNRSRNALKSDADMLRTANAALKNYPGVSSQATLNEPTARITWPRKRGSAMETMMRGCAEPDQFTRSGAAKPN